MQTTSFRISRYILLILVIILCTGIIAWTLVSKRQNHQNNAPVDNVIRITNTDPCVQDVTNKISQLWAYSPDDIPMKYLNMINEYINERITAKITGYCNDIKFTCKTGQLRKDCDPCALGSAKQFAMDQQIVDTVVQKCN